MKIRQGFVSNSSSSSFILHFKEIPKDKDELYDLLDEKVSKQVLDCIWDKFLEGKGRIYDEFSDTYAVRSECMNVLRNGIDTYFNEHNLDSLELINKSLKEIISDMLITNEQFEEILLEFCGQGEFESHEESYVYENGYSIFKTLLKGRKRI